MALRDGEIMSSARMGFQMNLLRQLLGQPQMRHHRRAQPPTIRPKGLVPVVLTMMR